MDMCWDAQFVCTEQHEHVVIWGVEDRPCYQGCRIGEFIVRFRKSDEFSKRLTINLLVWRFGTFLAIF